MSLPKPRTKAPDLELNTVDGDTWNLAAQQPENFTLIVVYRGLHCPICKPYLRELDRNTEEFNKRGVGVIAISTDVEERARSARDDWGLKKIPVGYGMTIDNAREWGLYISTSRGKTSIGVVEPDLFAEPGLFLVKPDQTLYWANIQSMPFARPHFDEVLKALDFVIPNDYPARGED